jgi:hypothetical protein
MIRIVALAAAALIALPAAAQDSVAPKMSATASQAAGSASAAAIVAVAATVAIPFVAAADIARQASGGTKLPLAAHRPVPAGPAPDEALRR